MARFGFLVHSHFNACKNKAGNRTLLRMYFLSIGEIKMPRKFKLGRHRKRKVTSTSTLLVEHVLVGQDCITMQSRDSRRVGVVGGAGTQDSESGTCGSGEPDGDEAETQDVESGACDSGEPRRKCDGEEAGTQAEATSCVSLVVSLPLSILCTAMVSNLPMLERAIQSFSVLPPRKVLYHICYCLHPFFNLIKDGLM